MARTQYLAAAALAALLSAGGLAGCGHDREPLPSNAVMLEEDKGLSTDKMSATVQHPGIVYVYDESDKRVIYTGRVNNGDRVNIDTFHDRISLNGRTVAQPEMDDAHRYRVYFEEDPNVRSRELNSNGTVIRKETTETQVAPSAAPRSDGTVIRRETTETQVPPGSAAPSDGTVIRKETTETQVPPR